MAPLSKILNQDLTADVFVTVGNVRKPFARLLNAVDRLAEEGFFCGQHVLVQYGHNTFESKECTGVAFLPMEDFVEIISNASLIICHSGAGTLMHILRAGKYPVVMPRRLRHKEHIDDHQLELVRALADDGRVALAEEADDLPRAIEAARSAALTLDSHLKDQCPGLAILKEILESTLRSKA